MTARQPASKELVVRRAIAAATQTQRPRRRHRAGRPDMLPMQRPAGLALTAAGLICALAVHANAGPVNVRTAGIIVTALGLSWLWLPVRNKRALLRRPFERAMTYLAWDPEDSGTVRCSLDELLERSGDEADDRAAR